MAKTKLSKKEKEKVRKDAIESVVNIIKKLEKCNLKPEAIAKEIEVSPRSIYRWRDEGVVPLPLYITALKDLLKLHRETQKQETAAIASTASAPT